MKLSSNQRRLTENKLGKPFQKEAESYVMDKCKDEIGEVIKKFGNRKNEYGRPLYDEYILRKIEAVRKQFESNDISQKDGFDSGRADRGNNNPSKVTDARSPWEVGYIKGFNSHPRDNDLYGDLR